MRALWPVELVLRNFLLPTGLRALCLGISGVSASFIEQPEQVDPFTGCVLENSCLDFYGRKFTSFSAFALRNFLWAVGVACWVLVLRGFRNFFGGWPLAGPW